MTIRTVPGLFALSQGTTPSGDYPCFYCGERCNAAYPAAQYVKSSFTGRDGVVAPGSPYVCAGCVLCLNESAAIRLIDGEHRTGQKTRGYSWLLTDCAAIAATKAHLTQLRAACLHPPRLPFAIVLSESGQKHLLYRGVVNHAAHHGEPVTVTLETERVTYRPGDLACRLAIVGRLISATGKPALAEPPTVRFAMAVMDRFRDGENLIDQWTHVREEPLSRLARFLSPAREECRIAYREDKPERTSETGAKTQAQTQGARQSG